MNPRLSIRLSLQSSSTVSRTFSHSAIRVAVAQLARTIDLNRFIPGDTFDTLHPVKPGKPAVIGRGSSASPDAFRVVEQPGVCGPSRSVTIDLTGYSSAAGR